MKTPDRIKSELQYLLNEQTELASLVKENKNILQFGTSYQKWYSRATKVIEALAPERLDEFTSYYRIDPKRKIVTVSNYTIQDYVMGVGATKDYNMEPLWDTNNLISIRIMNQMQILASLSVRIESVLQDVTGFLLAEIQDSELAAAIQLKNISKRAAGALAGVVLERHLQRVLRNHQISIRKKTPTIADLNEHLKKAEVYDVPTWRKIQLLADLRNICSHHKSKEPTNDQVDELISGVNSIIKSVF